MKQFSLLNALLFKWWARALDSAVKGSSVVHWCFSHWERGQLATHGACRGLWGSRKLRGADVGRQTPRPTKAWTPSDSPFQPLISFSDKKQVRARGPECVNMREKGEKCYEELIKRCKKPSDIKALQNYWVRPDGQLAMLSVIVSCL